MEAPVTAAGAGTGPRTSAPDGPLELAARFEKGIDLAKVRALVAEVREKGGLPAEEVTTLNLVSIHFSQGGYERNRASMEAASALHPARLISLIAEPKKEPAAVVARVAMVRPRGSAHALERIVLTATGAAVRYLESAVTGLLAPEVPLVVLWGGRPEGALLEHAADSADRLIIDSGTRPLATLGTVARLLRRGAPVGDLAWARIFPWQALAADLLDLPNLREHRAHLQGARVTTVGAPGPEAALLAGWFASRVPKAKVEIVAGHAGAAVATAAEARASEPAQRGDEAALPRSEPVCEGDVQELRFEAPPAVFTLRRDKGILVAQVDGDDDGAVLHRVRLPPDAPGRLLALELKLLAGQDEIYVAAVEQAARLLALPAGTAAHPERP
jgi:glucose-6-phosphate dehydrogenase assembly protein OpcA